MAQGRASLNAYFFFLLLTATIGPLLFGYHLAELNAPSDVLTCRTRPAQAGKLSRIASAVKDLYNHASTTAATTETLPQCIEMDATQFGIVSSFFTLGGLIGALAAGPISGRSGRVRSMLYAAILATVGPVFEALAPNVGTMASGRLIAGLGAGIAMVVAPIYIFDIAPPGRKGFFGSATQIMCNTGILITQVLGYFMSRGQMWRIILGIGGAIGLAQAASLLLAGQESPKYLAEHGRPTHAKRILQQIRGGDADIAEEVAAWGFGPLDLDDEEARLLATNSGLQDEVRASTSPARNGSVNSVTKPMSFLEVLRHPDTRPAVIAITGVMIAQQFTGINSIVMYGVSLLSSLLESNSALLNVFVSALNIVTTTAAAPMVEKLGRKTCLLISVSGMGSMSILLAIGIMKSIPILSAVAVMVFVSSFGLGLGPIPFILPSEFVDSSAVGAVQSWALAVNWSATFVVSMSFPILNEKLGAGQVYFIFAAMALLLGGFIAWYVPESKGKTDPDEVWGRRKGRRASD